MSSRKFTDAQVADALKLASLGQSVAEVCQAVGVSQATFYAWRKKYGDVAPPQFSRVAGLEQEIVRLKRLTDDLLLERQILEETLRKKV